MKRHGRHKPYTQAGVRRLPCTRCGRPSEFTWNACDDNGLRRPICTQCDILLNKLVLRFMRDPEWEWKIALYKIKVR